MNALRECVNLKKLSLGSCIFRNDLNSMVFEKLEEVSLDTMIINNDLFIPFSNAHSLTISDLSGYSLTNLFKIFKNLKSFTMEEDFHRYKKIVINIVDGHLEIDTNLMNK